MFNEHVLRGMKLFTLIRLESHRRERRGHLATIVLLPLMYRGHSAVVHFQHRSHPCLA